MRNVLLLLVFAAALTAGCKKDTTGYSKTALAGSWQYDNSEIDTMLNGQWTFLRNEYDPEVPNIFAGQLYFTLTDTVYYTYHGITAWSNYTVDGKNLVLIGSAISDTLVLRNVTGTNMQAGLAQPPYYYWLNFKR